MRGPMLKLERPYLILGGGPANTPEKQASAANHPRVPASPTKILYARRLRASSHIHGAYGNSCTAFRDTPSGSRLSLAREGTTGAANWTDTCL